MGEERTMLKNSLVVTFVVGALALGGCGSSSDGTATGGAGGAATGGSGGSTTTGGTTGSTGGSGGSTSTGGAGGSTGGASGSTGGASGATGGAGGSGGVPALGCGSSGNTCTKAETDAQNQCLINKCESAYTPCIGTGWRTGDFGGSCGAWFKCVNTCGCGNLNCLLNCGTPPAECQTCLTNANSCQMTMCPQPACFGMKADAGITLPGVDGG